MKKNINQDSLLLEIQNQMKPINLSKIKGGGTETECWICTYNETAERSDDFVHPTATDTNEQ